MDVELVIAARDALDALAAVDLDTCDREALDWGFSAVADGAQLHRRLRRPDRPPLPAAGGGRNGGDP
jgi:hypothetical protein